MESLISLIGDLVKDGSLADTTLLLIIISLLGVLYKFFLVPMFDRLSSVPNVDDLKQIIKASEDKSEIELKEVSNKLDKVIEALDEIESTGNANRRDIKDLRRDVEQIKQILNQFQGHFMYNGAPSHFGNRELK